MRSVLKPLPLDASKETRGRVLIVGGSSRYPGAILLAGRAAARSGAGVVTLAAGRSVAEMIAGQDPNLTLFPLAEAQPGLIATGAAAQLSTLLADKIRALLVGPGLAHATGTDEFVVAVRVACGIGGARRITNQSEGVDEYVVLVGVVCLHR